MLKLRIPVTEEWNHMYQPSEYLPYTRKPFERFTQNDCVAYSDAYSDMVGEPVWFYGGGNGRWLRCPIGRPGDVLNEHGDSITAVDVKLIRNRWTFVISVEPR